MGPRDALNWLRRHQLRSGALPVSSEDRRPYPEVTGYCLTTLWRTGEREMARRAARWLLECQSEDGCWPGPDMATPFWFDTAIAAGSLLALAREDDESRAEAISAVQRAADWLAQYCVPGVPSVVTPHHHPEVPVEINLLGLAMLRQFEPLAQALYRWLEGTGAATCSGKMQHFFCYTVEAIAITDRRYAWQIAGQFARARLLDGSLPAYLAETAEGRVIPRVTWLCYPAIAQWAALWAELGYTAAADDALLFLESRQTVSGGFTGGNGPYFPDEEVSWAAKYYLDACLALDAKSTSPADGKE